MPKKHNGIFIPRSSLQTLMEAPPEERTFLRLDITARQLEILTWVEQGKSATDIGSILGISHRTVEHHLRKPQGAQVAIFVAQDLDFASVDALKAR